MGSPFESAAPAPPCGNTTWRRHAPTGGGGSVSRLRLRVLQRSRSRKRRGNDLLRRLYHRLLHGNLPPAELERDRVFPGLLHVERASVESGRRVGAEVPYDGLALTFRRLDGDAHLPGHFRDEHTDAPPPDRVPRDVALGRFH